MVESRARTPTLSDDESTSELEPVDTEPCIQPQSQCGTASCGVNSQQKSGSCQLAQHRGHRDDSDRMVAESDWPKPAAGPHRRSQSPYSAAGTPRVETQQWFDLSVQDDKGEQNEGFVAMLRAHESRARLPRSPVEGSNAPELAYAKPSMQPSASPDQANLQHEGSEDEALRPPRRKRHRASAATHTAGGTAPQQQTYPYRSDSSREARRLPRRPRRQRGATHPSLSRESTLERDTETDRTPAATFEEWPLGNAVLKRGTMKGSSPTFMLRFTWGPCAEHGAGHPGTEDRGTVSSANRRRPARQASKRSTKDEDKPTSASSGARYTPADDTKIRQLKEQQGLSWIAIAKHFPGRSAGAIAVRYHTKLNTADPSRSESP